MNGAPPNGASPVVAELHIALNAAGQVTVTGCIDNIMMTHGLCELAKDVARERAAAAARSQIVKPDLVTTGLFGRKG